MPSESETTGERASGQHGADDQRSAKSQQVDLAPRVQARFKVTLISFSWFLGSFFSDCLTHTNRHGRMDKERFFEGCLTSELTNTPEPFTLPAIDKQKLPSAQVGI